ncbi:MAG: hypothetical protein ABIK09_04700 [Pseudomonadota bacterium]
MIFWMIGPLQIQVNHVRSCEDEVLEKFRSCRVPRDEVLCQAAVEAASGGLVMLGDDPTQIVPRGGEGLRVEIDLAARAVRTSVAFPSVPVVFFDHSP